MRAVIWLLGGVTVFLLLAGLFGLVADRPGAASISAPACGVGLITGILYLILASRQSRIDREAKEAEKQQELINVIRKQQS